MKQNNRLRYELGVLIVIIIVTVFFSGSKTNAYSTLHILFYGINYTLLVAGLFTIAILRLKHHQAIELKKTEMELKEIENANELEKIGNQLNDAQNRRAHDKPLLISSAIQQLYSVCELKNETKKEHKENNKKKKKATEPPQEDEVLTNDTKTDNIHNLEGFKLMMKYFEELTD